MIFFSFLIFFLEVLYLFNFFCIDFVIVGKGLIYKKEIMYR